LLLTSFPGFAHVDHEQFSHNIQLLNSKFNGIFNLMLLAQFGKMVERGYRHRSLGYCTDHTLENRNISFQDLLCKVVRKVQPCGLKDHICKLHQEVNVFIRILHLFHFSNDGLQLIIGDLRVPRNCPVKKLYRKEPHDIV